MGQNLPAGHQMRGESMPELNIPNNQTNSGTTGANSLRGHGDEYMLATQKRRQTRTIELQANCIKAHYNERTG